MLNPIKTTDFNAIKLKLASPEEILSWSFGEVTRPETINYRTQKPEKDGLFCEKIFGPSKDWECYCGKYKKIRYKGIVCDKCGVEVTRSIVRRERMGHIQLETPCTHIWFLRGLSSKIGLMLGLSMQALEKVVYFASFIVTDVNEDLKNATIEQIKGEFKQKKKSIESDFSRQATVIKARKGDIMKAGKDAAQAEDEIAKETQTLEKVKEEKLSNLQSAFNQAQKELKDLKPLLIISENDYQNLSLKYGHIFEAGIGAESIRNLLENIDLAATIERLKEELVDCLDSKKEKLTRRLKLFKSLEANDIKPEWMIMTTVPVIPPDLRPMVALDGGRFATSDLNDLYRRVINRNNRLKQLISLNAPEVICRNEKRMLQEAVDALIDNSARHGKTVIASTGQKRMLKSLADSLKGKQGRFRQNLLGKRIDYSGRSVIVVNPKLKLSQCGLPKTMAIELFKPFIISQLIKKEIVHNVRSASRFIDAGSSEVWDILEKIIDEAYVLLNRAPTLHRLGIQAFRPILIEGKAIQIHPLVCTAFNADFDGDQMAVHVPLTKEAIYEAEHIMLSSKNLLKPATGDPVVAPGQDIVWGSFYITEESKNKIEDKDLKYFSNEDEVKLAYETKNVKLHDPIMVRLKGFGMTRTTTGRIIFNEILPEKLKYVNEVVGKGKLKNLIKECLRHYGSERTVLFIDKLKEESFSFITKSGLSWGMGDLPKFDAKDKLIEETQIKVEAIAEQYEEGLLTDSERYAKVIEMWTGAKDKVVDICKKGLPDEGPVYSMIESGARGSWAQLTQILGMKGLVTSPSGDIIELPVKGNFKKGFGVLEYFISTHGVRKGLSDTALRTANAGYLTRRLVDVCQDIIIADEDCGDTEGFTMTKPESEEMGMNLVDRILGRYLTKDLKNVEGKVLAKKGDLIDEDVLDVIRDEEIYEAQIRSVLSCKLDRGVCAKCYGWDLGHNKQVKLGTAVGIIAAQSIGEPGTQLTMRTFHTGGIAGVEDITQGLPRVEEIFETRPPKRKAILAEVEGTVSVETGQRTIEDSTGKIIVDNPQSKLLKISYMGESTDKYYFSETIKKEKLSKGKDGKSSSELEVKILVKEGESVKAGAKLFKVGNEIVQAESAGIISIDEKGVKVAVRKKKHKEFIIAKGVTIIVNDGDKVKKGDALTDGSLDLHQHFELKDSLTTQKYIIREIQNVYSSQGQPLNDKHIEIVAKQMFSRSFIKDAGETALLPGEIVENAVVARANKKARAEGKQEATVQRRLMGITKASLTTDSFLSAASFQETARVLIEAAVSGKVDSLEGLKENVIIGRLIPAGTGYKSAQDEKARRLAAE